MEDEIGFTSTWASLSFLAAEQTTSLVGRGKMRRLL